MLFFGNNLFGFFLCYSLVKSVVGKLVHRNIFNHNLLDRDFLGLLFDDLFDCRFLMLFFDDLFNNRFFGLLFDCRFLMLLFDDLFNNRFYGLFLENLCGNRIIGLLDS